MVREGDLLIRIANKNNQNRAGKPRRSAFKTRDERMSVFLERLLTRPTLPNLKPKVDKLVFIPFEWVANLEKPGHKLHVEHDKGAHYEIVGKISIEFADFLRSEALCLPASEWVANFTTPSS